MRPPEPVFQFYRMADDQHVWWRMVSKNGRRIAMVARGCESLTAAHESLALVLASLDVLQPLVTASVASAGSTSSRWCWQLTLDRVPVVRGVGDHDRRVRCDDAWRRFLEKAPSAAIDPTQHAFQRGHAVQPASQLSPTASFVPRSSSGVTLVDLPGFDRRVPFRRSSEPTGRDSRADGGGRA